MFQVGDIFKACVQVKSKLEYRSVGKISYRARRPYIIINNIGHNPFEVQNCIDGTDSIRKYKARHIYILAQLLPVYPLDTIGQQYINY